MPKIEATPFLTHSVYTCTVSQKWYHQSGQTSNLNRVPATFYFYSLITAYNGQMWSLRRALTQVDATRRVRCERVFSHT